MSWWKRIMRRRVDVEERWVAGAAIVNLIALALDYLRERRQEQRTDERIMVLEQRVRELELRGRDRDHRLDELERWAETLSKRP